jgi:hypothetical protein
VRREAVAEAVEGRVLGDPGLPDGGPEGALHRPLVEMIGRPR